MAVSVIRLVKLGRWILSRRQPWASGAVRAGDDEIACTFYFGRRSSHIFCI